MWTIGHYATRIASTQWLFEIKDIWELKSKLSALCGSLNILIRDNSQKHQTGCKLPQIHELSTMLL